MSTSAVLKPASGTPWDVKLFYGFIVVLIVGMVALLTLWQPQKPPLDSPPTIPRHLLPFAFTNQAGALISRADVQNQFVVANFIHTSCSISCLRVNQQMAEVQRRTQADGDVRLLSFTVDPRTDTPPVLAQFGQQFGAQAERWALLTGNKTELYELIETSFLARDPTLQNTDMPGGFIGTERIVVVDRTGRVRRYFDGLQSGAATAIVQFLTELRAETAAP